MTKKSSLSIMAMLLNGLTADRHISEFYSSRKPKTLTPGLSEAERNSLNGLKLFNYPGGEVWAINKKNADKKAIKQGFK